jgi:hypothetical protein
MINMIISKKQLFVFFPILLCISIFLAGSNQRFLGIEGWESFFVIGLISSYLIFVSFSMFSSTEKINWIAKIFLVAFILRLAVGVAAFLALPIWGHQTCNQQIEIIINDCPEPNGYLYRDAYKRDLAAWDLANSDLPLSSAFNNYSTFDQYGGLLFLSSAIYRYISPSLHLPLLIVFFGSIFSGLSVLFTWGFAKQFSSNQVAKASALVVALYPEAIMLGASQVREAFSISLFMFGFYLLAKNGSKISIKLGSQLIIVFGVLYALSIPTGILFISIIALLSIAFTNIKILKNKNFQLSMVSLGILSAVIIWIQRDNIPALKDTLHLQFYYAKKTSGLLSRFSKLYPNWVYILFVLLYGVLRPLLPATIIATGNPIWKFVGIWRATGWTFLLLFLVYSTYLLVKNKKNKIEYWLLLIINWGIILIASFRGGGDNWDNPRYRVIVIGLQAILAIWAFYEQKKTRDPVLKRIIIYFISVIFWLIIWYLPKYIVLPYLRPNTFQNSIILGLIIGTIWNLINHLNKKY